MCSKFSQMCRPKISKLFAIILIWAPLNIFHIIWNDTKRKCSYQKNSNVELKIMMVKWLHNVHNTPSTNERNAFYVLWLFHLRSNLLKVIYKSCLFVSERSLFVCVIKWVHIMSIMMMMAHRCMHNLLKICTGI